MALVALELVARLRLVLGCRASSYLLGEASSGASCSPVWQEDNLARQGFCKIQSCYNGGLQPSNTSFWAAVTKPELTRWHWAENVEGRRMEIVGHALKIGLGKGRLAFAK